MCGECTGCTLRKIADTVEHVIAHRKDLSVPYCRVLVFYEPTLMLVAKFLRCTVPKFQPCLVTQVLRSRDLWADPDVYLALIQCVLEDQPEQLTFAPRMHDAVNEMQDKLSALDFRQVVCA